MNKLLCALTAIFVWAPISCEHKELSYDYPHSTDVQVVINWKKALKNPPETMRVYLFPLDGDKALPYEFTDYRGGRISVPEGRYKALCLNSDTESIIFRNINSFEKFEAYAPNIKMIPAPRADGTENERIAKSLERLYCGRLNDVTIKTSNKDQTVTFFPELSVCRYRIEIKNVSNINYISFDGVSEALTGMSGSLFVGRNELSSELVTVPFKVVSDNISTLTADFFAFGQLDSIQTPHQLVIYVIMSDGSKNYYTYDITPQVGAAANPHDIHIVLNKLSLSKPIDNGGGFHPEVNEWINVNVDIPM